MIIVVVVACVRFLTVCVQKGEHFSLRDAGTQQPGRDEALPLKLPHYLDNLQMTNVFLQFTLEVLCRNRTA